MAVTLMADPYGITAQERKDDEIGQWAASFPAKAFGSIPKQAIDQMFEEFKMKILEKLRNCGALRAGE